MPNYRSGIGYDIHKLESGNGLVIGGVMIPCEYKFVAHSDGDVLLHSICDAILGAIAAGDIGEWFPDNSNENKNRNSAEFVTAILSSKEFAGWNISNIDVNIIAQTPRLSNYKKDIKENVAKLFNLPSSSVNIKARTNEHCDAVGKKEAIQAQAIVMVYK